MQWLWTPVLLWSDFPCHLQSLHHEVWQYLEQALCYYYYYLS